MINLSSVDREARKMMEDSTPSNQRSSIADGEAQKMTNYTTSTKKNLCSVDAEARKLFNLPSIKSEAKTDLAAQTANLKAKLGGNKLGPLERAISNLKTQINSN